MIPSLLTSRPSTRKVSGNGGHSALGTRTGKSADEGEVACHAQLITTHLDPCAHSMLCTCQLVV